MADNCGCAGQTYLCENIAYSNTNTVLKINNKPMYHDDNKTASSEFLNMSNGLRK